MAKDPLQQLRVLKKASQKGKPINDCFRLLYKKELWIKAHAKVSFYEKRPVEPIEDILPVINELIQQLKKGSFRYKYSKTPQHLPPNETLLVLAAINLILDAVYQPLFSKSGRLKNNSSHQALLNVREGFAHFTWCIKGEISPSEPNHNVLISLLSRKISDRRFLRLIKTALIVGVLDKKHSLPLRSLLENIYLIALDEVIIEQLQNYAVEEQKNISHFQTDHFERTQYVRSGCEFVIGIYATKKDALTIFERLRQLFAKKLRLDSNDRKLSLSHLGKPIPFLGFEFLIRGGNRSYANAHKRQQPGYRPNAKKICLQIPSKKIEEFARLKGYGTIENNVITHRQNLINKTEREILGIYNDELKYFAQYYRLAENFHHLSKLFYWAEGSFIKTIACKRKSTYAKTARSMKVHQQGALAVVEKKPNGMIKICQFIKLSNFLNGTKRLPKCARQPTNVRKNDVPKMLNE